MAITTERNELVGSHFTPNVKKALKSEAIKQNKSMSELVYEVVREALKKLGHQFEK